MATHPKRYYLIRTPEHRGRPLVTLGIESCGIVRGNKRDAIRAAKLAANSEQLRNRTPVRNRRVSVYTCEPGQRPSLLLQIHVSRKTGHFVMEQL